MTGNRPPRQNRRVLEDIQVAGHGDSHEQPDDSQRSSGHFVRGQESAKSGAAERNSKQSHETGRPILVGTGSVEESEQLSARLRVAGIPHFRSECEKTMRRKRRLFAQAGRASGAVHDFRLIWRGGEPTFCWEAIRHKTRQQVVGVRRSVCDRYDRVTTRGGSIINFADVPAARAIREPRAFFISLEDDLLVRLSESRRIRTSIACSARRKARIWKSGRRSGNMNPLLEYHRREVCALRREILLSPEWSIRSMLPEEQYSELLQAVSEGCARNRRTPPGVGGG